MGGAKDALHFKERGVAIALDSTSAAVCNVSVVLDRTLHVPPSSEIEVMGRILLMAVHKTWIVEGTHRGEVPSWWLGLL